MEGPLITVVILIVAVILLLTQSQETDSIPGRPASSGDDLIPEDLEGSGEMVRDVGFGSGMDPLPPLRSILNRGITKGTVESAISETRRILAELPEKGLLELMDTVSIIERVAHVPNVPKQSVQEVLEIVDGLSGLNTPKLTQAKTAGNFSNRLIQSVEDLGRQVDLGQNSSVRLVSSTTALEVWDISQAPDDDRTPLGLRLKVTDEDEEEEEEEEEGALSARLNTGSLETVYQHDDEAASASDTEISIALNSSYLSGVLRENLGVRIWMTVFSDTSLFESAEEPDPNLSDPERKKKEISKQPGGHLNSKVISASVSANGVPLSHLSPSVVTSVFLPIKKVAEDQRAKHSRCVFWDMGRNEGKGGWSGEGCRYQQTLHGRDVCVCDHLTNFAVLMDFYGKSEQPPEDHQKVLSLMTVMGLSFSICGLFCTILTFVCIKKMHKVLPKQVLVNLASAMLLSWVIFLAGFSGASGSEVGCIAVAALLHYFILASFLWMLAEGLLQYLLLVKVHGHVRRFLLKASVAAWGIPAVPVATILAVDLRLYRGYDKYCWMSLMPFYYGFMLPVAVVLLTNLVIYVLVVVSICRTRVAGAKNPASKAGNRSKAKGVSVRASIACFVVLGLSWLFAFLAVSDARLPFQYLFTATTTLQGLLVFLLFTARDPLVQEFWGDKIRQGVALVRSRSTSSSRASGTARTASKGSTETTPRRGRGWGRGQKEEEEEGGDGGGVDGGGRVEMSSSLTSSPEKTKSGYGERVEVRL